MSDMSFLPSSFLGGLLNFSSQFELMSEQNRQQAQFYQQFQSPSARMRDMQMAGINPAAAAQGIASQNVPNLNAAVAGAGAAPNLASSLGTLAQNQPVASSQKALNDAEAISAKTQASVNEKQAEILGVDLKFAEQNWNASIDKLVSEKKVNEETAAWLKARNAHAEELIAADLDVARETANELRQRIKEEKESIELMKSQEGLNAALAREADSRNIHQVWINEQCLAHGWPPDGPQAHYLGLIADGKYDEAEKFLSGLGELQKTMSESEALGSAEVFDPSAVMIHQLRQDEQALKKLLSEHNAIMVELKNAYISALHSGDRDTANKLWDAYRDAMRVRSKLQEPAVSDREMARLIKKFDEKHGRLTFGQRIISNLAPAVAGGASVGAFSKGAQKVSRTHTSNHNGHSTTTYHYE